LRSAEVRRAERAWLTQGRDGLDALWLALVLLNLVAIAVRRGHYGPPGRALAGSPALRGQARRRGLRHDGRLPRRGLRLASRPGGAAAEPGSPGHDRCRRARGHGAGARGRAASPAAGPGRCPVTPWTRRRVLTLGLAPAAVLACAGVGGAELVSRGVLPGRTLLDRLDGACSGPAPPITFAPPGPAADGTFYSAARRRSALPSGPAIRRPGGLTRAPSRRPRRSPPTT
jgi:hypothetical protein